MAKGNVILVQEEPRGPSQLIEVPISQNGVTRVAFPDIQQLRSDQSQNIIVKGMRLITADVLTNGIINGSNNAAVAELRKMALVLYCEGWEKAQFIPILTLNDMQLSGGNFPFRFMPTKFDNWQNVDWSKSYIQYANGTSSSSTPYLVLFDVEYIRVKWNAQTLQWDEISGSM